MTVAHAETLVPMKKLQNIFEDEKRKKEVTDFLSGGNGGPVRNFDNVPWI